MILRCSGYCELTYTFILCTEPIHTMTAMTRETARVPLAASKVSSITAHHSQTSLSGLRLSRDPGLSQICLWCRLKYTPQNLRGSKSRRGRCLRGSWWPCKIPPGTDHRQVSPISKRGRLKNAMLTTEEAERPCILGDPWKITREIHFQVSQGCFRFS